MIIKCSFPYFLVLHFIAKVSLFFLLVMNSAFISTIQSWFPTDRMKIEHMWHSSTEFLLKKWMIDLIYHFIWNMCIPMYITDIFLFNYSGIGTWDALSNSPGVFHWQETKCKDCGYQLHIFPFLYILKVITLLSLHLMTDYLKSLSNIEMYHRRKQIHKILLCRNNHQ